MDLGGFGTKGLWPELDNLVTSPKSKPRDVKPTDKYSFKINIYYLLKENFVV